MKKAKKHSFSHKDPERIQVTPAPKGAKLEAKKNPKSDDYFFVKKDLKKTVITILIFVSIVIAILIIQEKTEILKPILSKFNL